MTRFEGSFDFGSLLAHLMDVSDDVIEAQIQPPDVATITAVGIGVNARHELADSYPYGRLPPLIAGDTHGTLLHERIHYWQLVSTTMHQLEFLFYLEALRMAARRAGLRPDRFAGPLLNAPPNDRAVEQTLESFAANRQLVSVEDAMVKAFDPVKHSQPTGMAYVHLPHPTSGQFLPGYAAYLQFGGRHTSRLVPFTVPYLVESAAYVAERLSCDGVAPAVPHLDGDGDALYLGCWEFFRRLHGPRYRDERSLALAYLAVVDLALNADMANQRFIDDEDLSEARSIPYRFGKLLFRAQGIPTVACAKDDTAEANISRFQAHFCSHTGWSSPAIAVRRTMQMLIDSVARAVAHAMQVTPQAQRILGDFLDRKSGGDPVDESLLADVCALIADAVPRVSPLIGQSVLGVMINASRYRLGHPGAFAAPILVADQLQRMFPLPVVVIKGHYFSDVGDGAALEFGSPYPLNAMGLMHDCLRLMTTSALQRHPHRCGFLQRQVPCCHVANSWGCPHGDLSPAEATFRQTTRLDDWCHWTLAAILLGNASPSAEARWTSARQP